MTLTFVIESYMQGLYSPWTMFHRLLYYLYYFILLFVSMYCFYMEIKYLELSVLKQCVGWL